MSNELGNVWVAILVTDGFEQVELTEPLDALNEAGATAHVIAPSGDWVRAWDRTDWGEEIPVDIPLERANPAGYDALLLPGGLYNPDKLRINPRAVEFVRHFVDARKPIAAICHGPWTLIEAGAVRGRRMTSYPSLRTDLENAGAQWVNEEVVEDGEIITSRNPNDLPAFIARMKTALKRDRVGTTAR